MNRETRRLVIAGPAGDLECAIDEPVQVRIVMEGLAARGPFKTKSGTLQWNNDYDRWPAKTAVAPQRDFEHAIGTELKADNEIRPFSVIVVSPNGQLVSGRLKLEYDASQLRVWRVEGSQFVVVQPGSPLLPTTAEKFHSFDFWVEAMKVSNNPFDARLLASFVPATRGHSQGIDSAEFTLVDVDLQFEKLSEIGRAHV